MTVPAFETYLLPMLKQYKSGKKIEIKDIRERLASVMNLNEQDIVELTDGGNAYKHNDRVYWSRTYLSKAGLLVGANGIYSITEQGQN